MNTLLLALSFGATAPATYSQLDSMLANTLIKHGANYEQIVLENLTKAQPNVIHALADQADKLEVITELEKNCYFVKVQDLTSDIRVMSQRYNRVKDCPPIDDVKLLPTLDAIDSCIKFNRAYAKTLENHRRINLVDAAALDEYILENKKHAELWEAMREAQSTCWSNFNRRLALGKIITLIGEDEFYEQKFPPCVPLWQFVEE